MPVAVRILILVALVLLNGLFALAEIAVVSASKVRLQQQAEAGKAAAVKALALASNPDDFLSTVQIGITLVGVFAGAFGGATLSQPLSGLLARVSWLAPFSDSLAFVLVVAVITYFSLVVGELLPKRLGLNDPERMAMALAGLMDRLSRLVAPLAGFLSASTSALLWLLRIRLKPREGISEEEIDIVITQGRRAGVIEPEEQEIIEKAFWLGERHVNAIMTPRPEVRWLDPAWSAGEILQAVRAAPHSRYLVCDGEVDQVIGYVLASELLASCLAGGGINLREAALEPLTIPETLPILTLLGYFKATGTHLAVVFDEYGAVAGVITLGAILEELVGRVMPAGAGSEPEVQRDGADAWWVRGSLNIDEFLELLGLDGRLDLSAEGYQTVSGFVADQLGRKPEPGDLFQWQGFDVRVEEMAGLRVQLIHVARHGDRQEGRAPS